MIIRQADIAIVVYYRPWPFFMLQRRTLFRFVARNGENRQVTWEKQPAADIERDFDKYFKDFDPKLHESDRH